jgi:very-short-patch-repair endonuclease
MLPCNKNLKQFSRALRKNMTEAERLLWSKLRGKQLKFQFYRQRIIGNYIADFYCPKAKLVIELDGGQHYEVDGMEKDMARDAFMSKMGLNVLRFSDRDVFTNLEVILKEIWNRL